jgi:hypothetical protein
MQLLIAAVSFGLNPFAQVYRQYVFVTYLLNCLFSDTVVHHVAITFFYFLLFCTDLFVLIS